MSSRFTALDELLQTPAKSSKTDLEAKEGLLLASNSIGLVVKGVRSLNPEAFGPELEKEAASRDSSAASLYDEATPVRQGCGSVFISSGSSILG